MEAVKNRLTGLGRDARAFVVDADADLVPDPGNGNFDQASRRRETHGIVEDRVERTGKAVGLAHDDGAVLARPGKGNARIAGLTARLPAVDKLLDQFAEIDGTKVGAGEFGVGPRRLADIADQAVHPADIVADYRGELGA